MSGRTTTQATPTRPVNQWVREAVQFARISQAELGRRLVQRGVISNTDRSIVNKMTTIRNVSHEEAVAISQITGYPLEKMGLDGQLTIAFSVLNDEEKLEVLSRILALVAQRKSDGGGHP